MNKTAKTILAAGLALAVATPALAELKVSGNYRLMGYSNELKDIDYEDGDSQSWIDQRLRLGVTNTLNDNVSLTYLAEIDNVWGSDATSAFTNTATGTRTGKGNGGAFDGDGVNVETKHAYLDIKSGDTSARLGLQGYADEFEGLVVNGDMTGAAVKHKFGDTSVGLLYAKWDENNGDNSAGATAAFSNWDDTDFYGVTVGQKISDTFKVGAAIYFLDVNDATDPRFNISQSGSNGLGQWGRNALGESAAITAGADADQAAAEIFFYGLTADAKFDDFGVNGFILLQDGELDFNDSAIKDQDSNALAASVKGTMKLANGNIGLRAIYISEDDDGPGTSGADDNGYWLGEFGEYSFINENQMIFLIDKFTQNATKEQYAIQDAARAGFGLMAFVLSGNHTLPDNMYVNWGAGYYMSMEDERNDPNSVTQPKPTGNQNFSTTSGGNYRDGDTLGYELCVRIGKKYFEKVDVSLNAAFADFGDFYDNTVNDINGGGTSEDPDSIYKTYLMVNVPF